MLKKRIIPCLDIKDGRTVKGVNFLNLTDAGDPVDLAVKYVEQGADELVFLDISATIERRKTLVNLVRRIAQKINIPFTVGGGITSVEDALEIIHAGADKVSINASAVKNPYLISKMANTFGSQCVVIAIDTKLVLNQWMVYIHGGHLATSLRTVQWAKNVEDLGAGEILLTSMNNDGTKNGFALELTSQICSRLNIPIIASGGAGKMEHFKDVFLQSGASGGLAASVFHFGQIAIPELKKHLEQNNIPVRL